MSLSVNVMSALGQKQTWRRLKTMSALPPKADIDGRLGNIRKCTHAPQAIRHSASAVLPQRALPR
jgi:hypothetical protein